MAEKMQVSRATLINYEKGHTAINTDVLNRLEKVFPDFINFNKHDSKPKIINENYIDFKVLYEIFIRGSKTILLATILSMFFGYCTSFLFTKYYNSEISLYAAKNDSMGSLSQIQSFALNFGIKNLENDQSFNIPDLVESRLIASSLLKNKWNSIEGRNIQLKDLWRIKEEKSMVKDTYDSLRVVEIAMKKLKNHISVNEDPRTGLIRIKTTFSDPIISSEIANFIGSQVQNYIQKENSAQSTKEKVFISERLLIVKEELESAELELNTFKERNRGYEDSPELFMVFSRYFRDVEAKKEVFLTLQQQLELARIEEVRQSPILHILDFAVPATRYSSPNRVLFLVLFALIGFFASYIIKIIKY